MADGAAGHKSFGPYFDDSGVIYRGIKVLVTDAGTTNAKTYWTSATKSGNNVDSGVLTDSDSDGIASAFFDGVYRFRVTQSDDSALDNPIDDDVVMVTADTSTEWEEDHGTSFPTAASKNIWQLFAKHSGGNSFQQLGINEGSAFKVLIDSANVALSSDYADLDAAITAIGATETTLRITSQFNVGGTPTVPATLLLLFDRAGSLNFGAAETVTIDGQIHAEPFQIFDSADLGDVDLSGSKVSESYPEWWGIDGTADEVEINKAIRATGNFGKVALASRGNYATADPVILSGASGSSMKLVIIEGNGARITSTSSTDILTVGNSDDTFAVENCGVYDLDLTTTNTDALYAIKLIGAFTGHNNFENIFIEQTTAAASPQANSVGVLLFPGGLGCYRNRFENTRIVGFDYGVSFGKEFVGPSFAAQAPNRTYFDGLYIQFYDTYGVFYGFSQDSEMMNVDFENSNGAGAVDLYINATTQVGVGLKFFGAAETQSTNAVEIESGSSNNFIVIAPHGKAVVDNNGVDGKNTIIDNQNILTIENLFPRNIAPITGADISIGETGAFSLIGSGAIRTATTGNVVFAKTRKTLTDADATPDVDAGNNFQSGTTGVTITAFFEGIAGQDITIVSKGAIVYDTSSANRLIGSSVDITTAAGDITMWHCETGGTTSSVWILKGFIDVSADNSAGA